MSLKKKSVYLICLYPFSIRVIVVCDPGQFSGFSIECQPFRNGADKFNRFLFLNFIFECRSTRVFLYK